MSIKSSWSVVPVTGFNQISALRDKDGNIVATVQNRYVEMFKSLPEFLATTREIFDKLTQGKSNYDPNSLLGQLNNIMARIEESTKDDVG